MHPIYAFHLANKELTFLPEKWELKEKKALLYQNVFFWKKAVMQC